jgi:hypothetical protein
LLGFDGHCVKAADEFGRKGWLKDIQTPYLHMWNESLCLVLYFIRALQFSSSRAFTHFVKFIASISFFEC